MPLPAIAAALLPMIPNFINLAETLIRKEKSGPEKLDLVTQLCRVVSDKYAALNAGAQPTDDELRGMIQAVFTAQPPAPDPRGPARLYLMRGAVCELKEAAL